MLNKKIIKSISKFAKPVVKLNFGDKTVFSKLGGFPEMPNEVSWPKNSDGKIIPFYFQIDFSEINKHGKLENFPRNGLLYLFVDENAINTSYPYLNGEHFKVLYFANATRKDKLKIAKDCEFIYPETKFEIETTVMYPYNEENNELDELIGSLTESDQDNYFENYHYQDVELVLVGGYPEILQSSYLQENEVQLFELQSINKDGLDVMWGDVGMLQFYIDVNDLKKCDFDNVKCNLETT